MSNMNMEHAAQIEQGLYTDPYLTELAPHESKLSNFLYILSFAPPFPSPFRKPRAFISHPYTLYILGTLSAMVAGVGLPAFDIVFGYWTNGISRLGTSSQDIQTRGNTAGWIMTMIGVVTIACFAAFLTCFSLAGIQLSNRLREQYLAAILVQDQAFFDRIGPGEIVTRASKDVDSVRVGLGERLGYIVWSASSMLACLISAFVHAPRLAGFLFAIVPTTGVLFTALGYWSDNVLTALAPLDGRASSLIEQILSSVRIVQSFDLGPRLIRKLEHDMLGPLRRAAKKKSGVRALEQATVYGLGFLVYCMAYWFGGIEVARGLEVGDLLTTFFNVINCSFLAASLVPHLVATSTAVTNLSTLRLQIERKPPIDVRDPSGTKLDSATLSPSFELQNVTFAYPSRPSNKALDDVSVTMEAGKFTAFVGPSGSGKSTAASLLLRLYDPGTSTDVSEVDREIMAKIKEANGEKKEKKGEQEEKEQIAANSAISGSGTVRFAGHDIQTLNLKWLRSQVAVVLQNPQLVSGTVFDNVAVGLTGTDLEYRSDIDNGPNPSPEDKERMQRISQKVEEALKKAQAWDFVCALPDGLETKVTGGRTGVLSGGQVQRVALARALVREPKCLLLDEATSAVSADTEQKIQEALLEEQRQRGMTLIVIAHRLSTIVAADRIFVMVAGRAVHSGTYDELLQPDCPDQTFRSMALVKHTEMPSSPASSSPSESSTSLALSPSTPKVPTPEVPHQVTIPPRMLKTSKAFLNVKYYLIVGFFVGLAGGASFAIAAWLHGRAVNGLRIPDIPLMRATSNRWALWYLVLAIVTFFVYLIFVYGFEYGGEHIVGELRRESVRALIRQDIAFFESGDTGTGGLTAAATTHPSNVGNVVGLISAQAVSSIANLLAVTIMSFVLSWRLAVMVLPALGVTMLLGRFNFDCLHKFEKDIDVENSRQADFVGESANSVQMIAALTREAETMRQFKLQFTAKPTRRRWLFYGSVAMGGSQGMLQLFAALMFHWGSKQLAEGRASLADLYTVIEGVVIAIYISARILTFTGDFTRMNASLKTIQYWMDREPVVGNAIRDPSQSVKGDHIGIEFRDVELRYPSRPKVLSLDKVNLRMEPGKSYAFCGTSGAGKSSILAVLQRFYDPTAGAILLDGVDIRDMDVKDLRSQMGYVSQEPILFEETVRWNLASGAIDPESVTDADLESACEEACMMPFIRSLPQGFDTPLGMKGGQLSGGQRQRLCIARALLRKPRILLLDEATSALDGQSEAKVQQALDNASRGRMTVTIAHRLSTIRKADVISVMEQGRIVESGSHEELLALKGRYLELVQAQL